MKFFDFRIRVFYENVHLHTATVGTLHITTLLPSLLLKILILLYRNACLLTYGCPNSKIIY